MIDEIKATLHALMRNTYAVAGLLAVFALCATALVWHGDLTVGQLKAALLAVAYGAGATWLRGSPAPAASEPKP